MAKINPINPASPPSTIPATVETATSPTQSAEEKAAETLLMLAEAAALVQEDFDLADEEYQSPVSSPASSNMEVAVYRNNVALDAAVVKDPEDRYESTDEQLDVESDGERLEAEIAVQELGVEADPLIMQARRRCNRGNGRGWICGKLAQSGYTMCPKHVKARREALHRFRAKRL
ncbi:hypothetical protein ZWY2020_031444 [Hordeum vulgare]|nr:hypothetical protein ZWY2020_031444 [Hordeum vulgare]